MVHHPHSQSRTPRWEGAGNPGRLVLSKPRVPPSPAPYRLRPPCPMGPCPINLLELQPHWVYPTPGPLPPSSRGDNGWLHRSRGEIRRRDSWVWMAPTPVSRCRGHSAPFGRLKGQAPQDRPENGPRNPAPKQETKQMETMR